MFITIPLSYLPTLPNLAVVALQRHSLSFQKHHIPSSYPLISFSAGMPGNLQNSSHGSDSLAQAELLRTISSDPVLRHAGLGGQCGFHEVWD